MTVLTTYYDPPTWDQPLDSEETKPSWAESL